MKIPRLISRKSQLSVPQENPDINPQPSYKSLLNAQTECRLVCVLPGRTSDPITCSTDVVPIAEAAGRYSALSYCWGSRYRTRPITCDGQSLNVTPDLESALRRLRSPNVVQSFWIDQLCIDQDNAREKEQQIRVMTDIYRRSCKVLIWLGDDGEESRKVYKVMDRLLTLNPPARHDSTDNSDDLRLQKRSNIGLDQLKSYGLPAPKDTVWQELRNLLSRPWFSRIWTIPEAAVAVDADFIWGKEHTISWDGMVTVIRLVRESLAKTLLGSDMILRELPADSVFRISATRRTLDDRVQLDLFNLAMMYKAYGASEPHDKLYALLNLSTSSQVTDYTKGIESIYHEVAHQTINHVYEEINKPSEELSQQPWHPFPGVLQGPHLRMVALICAAGIANQQLSLPSWVPDWTVDVFPAPIWTRKNNCKSQNSAHANDRPGVLRQNSRLERSTIINKELAEIQWSAPSQNLVGSSTLPTTLHIKGVICDTISRRVFAKVDMGKHPELEEQQKALMEWLIEADEMADLGPETMYSGGADTELFKRTLLFDEEMPKPPGMEKLDSCKALRFTKNSRFTSSMRRTLLPWDYLRAIHNIPGRTFFVTQGGRMGLAPHATHMYDKICVLPGFEVPLVLRPEGTEFRIVGECYAGNDDMMPGGSEYSQMMPDWITIK